MSQVQLPEFRRGEFCEVRSQSVPWHLADNNVIESRGKTPKGLNVLIGLVDSGVDADHPELKGRIAGGESFVGRRHGPWNEDYNDHGTWVAGMIVSKTYGMAPNAKVFILKALGANGAGSNGGVAKAVYAGVEAGCTIINLSIGSPYYDPNIRAAILFGKERGVVFVIAAGNEGGPISPMAEDGVCTGALDRKLKLAPWSNTGSGVDVVGPGVNVQGIVPEGRMQLMSGTSMVAPYISGGGALIQSDELARLGSIRTTSDVELLKLTSKTNDLGPRGRDPGYGWGTPDWQQILSRKQVVEKQMLMIHGATLGDQEFHGGPLRPIDYGDE